MERRTDRTCQRRLPRTDRSDQEESITCAEMVRDDGAESLRRREVAKFDA